MKPELLSVKELAERWQITPHTLAVWRKKGTGPPFMKIGHKIFYQMYDVLKFEQENRRSDSISDL